MRIQPNRGLPRRSRDWVIQEAITRYLDYEEWFARQGRDGLQEADEGAKTIPHDQVMAEMRKKIAKAQR